jgi:hypothetical protein
MLNRGGVIYLMVLASAAAVAWEVWQARKAREIAESWLLRNKFKVKSLRRAWFSTFSLTPKLFRDEDRSVTFRVEVEDRELGGGGVAVMRVWVDRIGLIDREPEIRWEAMRMANSTSDASLSDRWLQAQLDLLQRVANGETTFSIQHHRAADAMPFDELVEHLLALRNRGMILCDEPLRSRTRESQFDAITVHEITDTGRAYLKIKRA